MLNYATCRAMATGSDNSAPERGCWPIQPGRCWCDSAAVGRMRTECEKHNDCISPDSCPTAHYSNCTTALQCDSPIARGAQAIFFFFFLSLKHGGNLFRPRGINQCSLITSITKSCSCRLDGLTRPAVKITS